MFRVRILADRLTNQNTAALLYPIFRFKQLAREQGLDIDILFENRVDQSNPDLLVVFDRFLGARDGREKVGQHLNELGKSAGALAYFDTGDSSGLLHREALEASDIYLKSFVLKPRERYSEAHYGGRAFTDYYHRRCAVTDDVPLWSEPVTDSSKLDKVRVAWSPALFPYQRWANRAAKAYRFVRMPLLLRWPRYYRSPRTPRPLMASCRMSSGHNRRSVVYQRECLQQALVGIVDTDFISRRGYEAEMRRARAVISPFGWGEYAIRDYEAMESGAALIKPDMSHLETWPAIYQAGETYVPLHWDLNDLSDIFARLAQDSESFIAIAERGQSALRAAQSDGSAFVRHLTDVLRVD
ncbi:MAG: hypothetical protein RID42_07530 [Alphaproteobacteria bacterium]